MSGPVVGLVSQGGARWVGGAEYIGNLARAVVAAGGSRPRLFSLATVADQWREVPAEVVPVQRWVIPYGDRLGLNRRHLREALRRAPVDFVFPFTYGNGNIGMNFPVQPVLGNTRWAGWIPDFQHRHLPHFFGRKDLEIREEGIRRLLGEAPVMVMSSASAAEDLKRFHPEYGGRVEVLRFATAPRAEWYEAADAPSELPDRYFAVCNQFWVHKNHLTVFRALALLAGRGVRPVLVCTGAMDDNRDPAYPAKLREALEVGKVQEQVRFLGLISRRNQVEGLRRSVAVVQPSLFEGWSTVVEDARVLGKRLLLSDIAVHREQAPPGAEYFEPENVEALAALMEAAWNQWPAGQDLVAEGEARRLGEARLAEVGRRLLEIAGGSRA